MHRRVFEVLGNRLSLCDVFDLAHAIALAVGFGHQRHAECHPHRVPIGVDVALLQLEAADLTGT